MSGPGPRVSVVAPVHNEAAVLAELGHRCLTAVRRADPHGEVLLVDDASTDHTRDVALPPGVRLLSLARNQGQLGATQTGLAHARGEVVVVLDGDLQDPPEVIPDLVRTLDRRMDPAGTTVVFATKIARDDPAWFRLGRALYDVAQRLPGVTRVPQGVGAYVAMPRRWAHRVAAVDLPTANLAAVLVALGARSTTVPYAKGPRYDGQSRIGALGLSREAIASLQLTGAWRALGLLGALAVLLLLGLTDGPWWAEAIVAIPTVAVAWRMHRATERTRSGLLRHRTTPDLLESP